jgi:hypothetical protein
LRTTYVKTDGATTGGDDFHPVKFYSEFDQGDAQFGQYYGLWVTAFADACADGSGNVFGGKFDLHIDADANIDNIMANSTFVDINGGVVDEHIYGQYINVDIEDSDCKMNCFGQLIQMDDDSSGGAGVDGTCYGTRWAMGDNVDFAWQIYTDSPKVEVTPAGEGYWDGTVNNGAADYAEYFESTDGSVIPIGNTVVLENGKIRQSESGETPIGIIRPHDGCAMVGNSSWAKWQEKYLTDDYGAKIMESFTKTKWSVEITSEEYHARGKDETGGSMGGIVTDERVEGSKEVLYIQGDELPEGKEVGDVKEAAVEDVYSREHKYHSDRIPEALTAPDDAEVIEMERQRQKLNPDYDPDREYESREERDEWHIVGLLGQIPITKGQPTGSSWIKMKDISNTVEMWFVK